ncbi:MAG: PACE efflux transporter [Paracoccaceae bacterium]
MTPLTRKITYAISFETLGILVEGAGLLFMSDASASESLLLAAICAAFAMTWSLAFNAMFEGWEARQTVRGRPMSRRALHTLLFEGGLTLLLLPFLAWWLQVSLLRALTLEAGLIAIFVVYTYVFTWAFDAIFGLPPSAR